MKGLKYVILITHREYAENYVDFFKSKNCKAIFSDFCEGTATDGLLNLLSLERKGKVMIKTFVRSTDYQEILYDLKTKTNITYPGHGIVIALKTGALGGEMAKNYLIGEEPVVVVEEEKNVEANEFSLIITIANKGNVDLIMDSARGAGATGGTVVKGKGTGNEKTKFFGINISEEKEMIYIVVKKEQRDKVMSAIMQNAGIQTEAHGIVFSIPVESVLGLSTLTDVN